MLKIKNNVDLKELEKYGFEFNQYPNKEVVCFNAEKSPLNLCDITFWKKERELQFNLKTGYWCNDIESLEIEYKKITDAYNKFKQLIDELKRADLVEKIDD